MNDSNKEFLKRYDKFKKNNLPTPFYDEERHTIEYVYYSDRKYINDSEKSEKHLEVHDTLTTAFEDIAYVGFYYSFTTKIIMTMKENRKITTKVEVGHSHAHSFDEVVRALYDAPESFSISKEEEEFYSKQELKYLRRLQKYLLFIGMKDLETRKAPVSRYRNKLYSKYANVWIKVFDDESLKNIMNNKINFKVKKLNNENVKEEKYKSREYQALIVDKEDNFKMFVEFTKREVKTYKDIKDVCKIEGLQDNDKVLIEYFKILEKF